MSAVRSPTGGNGHGVCGGRLLKLTQRRHARANAPDAAGRRILSKGVLRSIGRRRSTDMARLLSRRYGPPGFSTCARRVRVGSPRNENIGTALGRLATWRRGRFDESTRNLKMRALKPCPRNSSSRATSLIPTPPPASWWRSPTRPRRVHDNLRRMRRRRFIVIP
jgi:hypothetical protein